MAITTTDATRIINHALGGDPQQREGTTYSAVELANDAGRWMLNAHAWNWCSGARATLSTVAAQPYITLPSDFLSWIGEPYRSDGQTGGFEWVSLQTLAQLAVEAPTLTGDYLYAALTWDQSGAGAPDARLELYPTPATSEADVLTGFYRRGWTPYVGGVVSSAKIPVWMEGVYIAALEAYARGWEDGIEHPAARQQYLAHVMAGPEWMSAVRIDATAQPHVGVIKNGVLSPRQRYWSRVSGLDAPA